MWLRGVARRSCQKFRSEVLLGRVAQRCRSEVSDMCLDMLPELSLRSVAQKRRLHVCVCTKVSLEVLRRSVPYVCVCV